MNKIEQMIKDLCPEGVKWVKLGEVIEYLKTGLNPRDNFKLNTGDSVYSYVTGKDIRNNKIILSENTDKISKEAEYRINKRANLEVGNLLFASTGTGTVGRMAIIERYNHDWNISETLYNIKTKGITFSKYLLFILQSEIARTQFMPKVSKGSVPHLKVIDLLNISIPLPPLPIQQQIVTILDKFESMRNNLEKELSLRRKQYEHYREKLLTFGEDVERKKLVSIAEIGTGSKNTIDGKEEGLYPFYTRGQEVLRMDEYEYDETAIITAGDGAGVGKTFHFVSGKYALHQRAYRIVPNVKLVDARFLYFYILKTFFDYIMQNSVFGSVPSVRRPKLEAYPIPLPPLSTQESIVSKLDKFEALISNIERELELRTKQYEYYREKLLTF